MTIDLHPSEDYPGRTALRHKAHPESNITTILHLTAEDMAELRAKAAEGAPAPRKFNAVALQAVEAWVIEGPVPAYHQAQKERLRRDWPTLWNALEAMAHFDGITTYVPPAPPAPKAPVAVSDLGRPRHEEGLYALTKLEKDLPAGPAHDMVRGIIRRPYRAALAALLIAAQLGSRSDWSGADELQGIGDTLAGAGMALGDEPLYRPIADQFGIAHDGE